jgi:hypothetical protein
LGDTILEEGDALLLGEDERLMKGVEGMGRVGVGERAAVPDQNEGDPQRIGMTSRCV